MEEFFSDAQADAHAADYGKEANTHLVQDYEQQVKASNQEASRFATPLREHQMEQLRRESIPEKTRAQTEWAVRVWQEWALTRSSAGGVEIPGQFVVAAKHEGNIASFMCSFVTEVCRKDDQVYPPLSLCQLCCLLQRATRHNFKQVIELCFLTMIFRWSFATFDYISLYVY